MTDRFGKGGAALTEAVARNADDYARDLAPVLQDIRAEGNVSLRAPAELNRRHDDPTGWQVAGIECAGAGEEGESNRDLLNGRGGTPYHCSGSSGADLLAT